MWQEVGVRDGVGGGGRRQPGLRVAGRRVEPKKAQGRQKLFGDGSGLEYFSVLKISKSYYHLLFIYYIIA